MILLALNAQNRSLELMASMARTKKEFFPLNYSYSQGEKTSGQDDQKD